MQRSQRNQTLFSINYVSVLQIVMLFVIYNVIYPPKCSFCWCLCICLSPISYKKQIISVIICVPNKKKRDLLLNIFYQVHNTGYKLDAILIPQNTIN